MFRPLFLYIGLRYTRAKRRNHFISFISLASVLGIALGVAVLITVLSVMNGFDEVIHNRVFDMAPPVTVESTASAITDWSNLIKQVSQNSNVVAAAPYVSGQGLLNNEGTVRPAIIQGIDPILQTKLVALDTKMVQGKLSELAPGTFGIILGEELANNLGIMVGQKVTVLIPQTALTPLGVIPRYKQFKVVGIFNPGGGFGFDSSLGFINLQDAQTLYQLGEGVTGINLKIKNLYDAPQVSQQIAAKLSADYFVSNWTERYGPLFKAISLEKNMMFLMLILIIAVAAFNLLSSLVMLVADKQSDIAILRTFGATPKMIMGIFIAQGSIVGFFGAIMGLIGGIALATHVNEVVSVIQKVFHIQLISANVYYVNYLPSRMHLTDITKITAAAFVLSLLATLYPAWRASRVQPAEALRYE